jgi:excinuclease ABC subunit C
LELVQSWVRFFDGDVRPLRELLSSQMEVASRNQHYEAAAKARDGLAALERAARIQSVVLDDRSSLDVLAMASEGSRSALVRFRVRFGRVVGRTVHLVDRSMDESDSEILESALTHLYGESESVPATVVVERSSFVSSLSVQYLCNRRAGPVRVHVAQRGKRRRVLDMASRDAAAVIQRDSLRRQSDHNVRSRALQELGQALSLREPPYRIECFDMSHLQGTDYVGSMVVFEDALALKRDYRHFTIKEVLGNDDVGAMHEVLLRRLSHWSETATPSKFRRADLIVIDGGPAQLHAAQAAARALGLEECVEFVALAKREELLYRPGRSTPVALERGSESLYLVQRIRDEAHRFAISFHRSKRGKSMIASTLEGVRGLGPTRRERLVLEFGSLRALRQASLEELRAVTWLPEDVARRLYDHLQGRPTVRLTKESANDE